MTLKEVMKVMDNTIKDCRHRKRQGKIGRRDIKRKVQAMWRSLSASTRELYEDASRRQVEQCQAQLKAWRASQEEDSQTSKEGQKDASICSENNASSSSSSTSSASATMKLTNNNTITMDTLPCATLITSPLHAGVSPPTRTMSLPETMFPSNLLGLSSTSVIHNNNNNYGESESESDTLSLHGSFHGMEETSSCSSEPAIMPLTCQIRSDDTVIPNNNNNNNNSSMDFTYSQPPQEEETPYVQTPQPHNYVDLCSQPVGEEKVPQQPCRYHPLTNNNHTNKDDNDQTWSSSLPTNIDVNELAFQLDVESVAFICSTFNS